MIHRKTGHTIISIINKITAALGAAREVQRRSGKSIWAQLADVAKLRFGPGRLGFSEYYTYRLFDDEHWSPAAKREVVGWRRENYYGTKLNARPWNVLTGDKLVAYAVFRGLSVPHPELFAVFHPFGRSVEEADVLTSEEQLADYLRKRIHYPFFSKPTHGALGRNSVAVVSYDAETDSLVLSSGKSVPVAEYVKGCYPQTGVYPWESGFLFQERLEPDPDMAARFGSTVSSMRMICLNPDDTPTLLCVVWKIPVAGNMTDNFDHGSSGNLLANIDTNTGEVTRVITGTGLDLTEVSEHPDTGESFVGWRIPEWEACVDLCHRATAAFPGIRLQHWDMAVTDRGPVILELNTFGDFDLPQLAAGRGILTPQFVAQLELLSNTYPVYRGGGDY